MNIILSFVEQIKWILNVNRNVIFLVIILNKSD